MFSLTLSKDLLRVEPGSATTLSVTVHNKGQAADRYELDVGGLDQEWLAIPVPTFVLAPGEERAEKILIKPPRSAESKCGAYPFILKVRSLESGDAIEAPAVLELEPFHLTSLEVEPKRGASGYFRKQCHFAVTAINLGNADQNLQLFADDPEDGCTYQFSRERVQLSPGQQKEIALTVQPTHFPVIGSPRLFGFAVSARGIENPHLVASAQAQIERRALVTPAFLLIAFAVVLIGGLWYGLRPAPATIDSFSADRAEVLVGESVTLSWSASRAKSVTIVTSDGQTFENLRKEGEKTLTLKTTTIFRAFGVNDLGRTEDPKEVIVTVREPPVVPLPVIDAFTVSPKEIYLGQVVEVKYKVRDAVRIQLQPDLIELPPDLDSFEFRPTQAGPQVLTLVASNSQNKSVRRTAKLLVNERSDARILIFRALLDGEPLKDEPLEPLTRVVIEWHVTGAARAEIQPDVGVLSDEKGTAEVAPAKTTVYTLTAVDASGRSTLQKITIKVRPEEPPGERAPPP